jgi:hypothetical protein
MRAEPKSEKKKSMHIRNTKRNFLKKKKKYETHRKRELMKVMSYGTCIDKAVVEMEAEQGRPHAGLLVNSGSHGGLDDAESVRACFVVEISRELR